MTALLTARAELDKELRNGRDSQGDGAAKVAVYTQAKQLSNLAQEFTENFPTNTGYFRAAQQKIYGDVLSRMLHKESAARLGNLAEHIPSCLFETETSKRLSFTMVQSAQLQAAFESGFADAAIDAFQLGPESANGVFEFIRRSKTDAGKRLARALVENPVGDDSLKDCARAVLNRKYSTGQTLSLKFTALDGRQVDIMRTGGKVVLVDFWATTCSPCMSELPELKALYQKYRNKGFEIVGVSTDTNQKSVLRVIQEKDIPWPNYWDEKGLRNQFAVACGVSAIPDYWLVDRNGIVCEMGARDNLEKKIEFLISGSE